MNGISDLKNVNTYAPRLSEAQSNLIAGYLKPFLPPYLEIPAICRIDRIEFVDKEIRKAKGNWEKKVLTALNALGHSPFRKRRFSVGGEDFEIDAAAPETGGIRVGIDIKRIEARRDIHKRCDEIVTKAWKLKEAYPRSKFGAVIYYPFIQEHVNIESRMRSSDVDAVVFASESEDAISNAVKMLPAALQPGSR